MSARGVGGNTMFSGGRWLFVLSFLMVVGSASASSDVASGLTELQKCGDQCTFWLDTNKMMFKTGGPCTCSQLSLFNKGIAKIANGTVSDMPNLQSLHLRDNEIAELEPGWVSNVSNLQVLYLDGNPGVPFACPTVSSYSSGCEMNRALVRGGCTFWVDALRGWMLFKTWTPLHPQHPPKTCLGSMLTLTPGTLSGNKIAKIANGTVSDMPNLEDLHLKDNEITELEPGWVRNVPNLRGLDLFRNKMAKLAKGTVSDMPNLESLNLYANEIAEDRKSTV